MSRQQVRPARYRAAGLAICVFSILSLSTAPALAASRHNLLNGARLTQLHRGTLRTVLHGSHPSHPTTHSSPRTPLTPTVSPTVSPTVAPTVAPTVTPALSGHPSLILTQSDIDAIRARLAAGLEPQASAFRSFMNLVAEAYSESPAVFAGPVTTGGVSGPLELALDSDGHAARTLALAYAFTGDLKYATKAREYLMAWATGNTPTTFADCGDKFAGSYQSHGLFSFAYAYDLTCDAGVYSDADRTVVASYFHRAVDALDTFMDVTRGEWVMTHPTYTQPYEWNPNLRYYVIDRYVGDDQVLLTQAARLAMAHVIGYTAAENDILNDTTNTLNLQAMVKAALTPRNDGDGVAGHPVPAPEVLVWGSRIVGRGGTLDYMTYNTRVVTVLVTMAQHLGWDATKVADAKAKLASTWTYLARFFGPAAEPDFNPDDVIDPVACLPRFTLAYGMFGDSTFKSIIDSGDRSTYYEPQLLGPVTLTASIAP